MTSGFDDKLVLGIETTCDETAAAVVRGGREVVSSIVLSQHDLHEEFGGVVPEVASRAHAEAFAGIVQKSVEGVGLDAIEAIAGGDSGDTVDALAAHLDHCQSQLNLDGEDPPVDLHSIFAGVAAK